MLIEAKWIGAPLDISKESQFMRYFNVTPAKIGILTNGHEYRFYTDLDEECARKVQSHHEEGICSVHQRSCE